MNRERCVDSEEAEEACLSFCGGMMVMAEEDRVRSLGLRKQTSGFTFWVNCIIDDNGNSC